MRAPKRRFIGVEPWCHYLVWFAMVAIGLLIGWPCGTLWPMGDWWVR